MSERLGPDDCHGECKGPRSVRYVTEMVPAPHRPTPFVLLHDAERCVRGALVAAGMPVEQHR